MRLRFLTLLTIACLLPIRIWAADTLHIEQKLLSEYNHTALFHKQIWQNSAIRYNLRPFSLTTTSVNGLYEERGSAALVQEGNGEKEFQYKGKFLCCAEPAQPTLWNRFLPQRAQGRRSME